MVNRVSQLNHFRSASAPNAAPMIKRVRNATPIPVDLPHGSTLYPTALELPPDLTLDAWGAIGAQLAKIEKGLQWALGDWWAYGFHQYGERKAIAKAKCIPYEFGSLMNLGYVARRVATSLRNEALSFNHHYAVAKLEPEDQTKWLDRAARSKWSVKTLRQQMCEREQIDLDDQPERRASDMASYIAAQADRARNVDPFHIGIEAWDEPWLDHLGEGELGRLIEAISQAAETLTDANKGLNQYRKKRLAKGAAFVARPMPRTDVPRVSDRVYDHQWDEIDDSAGASAR